MAELLKAAEEEAARKAAEEEAARQAAEQAAEHIQVHFEAQEPVLVREPALPGQKASQHRRQCSKPDHHEQKIHMIHNT